MTCPRLASSGRPGPRLSATVACSLSLLWLASSLGCGQGWEAETHPVRGSVMVNGEPAAGAVVTLYPAGEKVDVRNSKPWGVVESDGTFSLQTYEKGDGAPAGEYVLTLKWPLDVADMSQALTDRLGGAYAFPERSQWHVSVVAGDNVLDAIEVDGAKVEAKPRSSSGTRSAGPPGPSISG